MEDYIIKQIELQYDNEKITPLKNNPVTILLNNDKLVITLNMISYY